MKKTLLAAAMPALLLFSGLSQAQTPPEGYQLQQVLMMSRHNLRAPLATNGCVRRWRPTAACWSSQRRTPGLNGMSPAAS